LSRPTPRDPIMGGIVEEVGFGTGADHIVVARRRPDSRVLEATLVNASGGPPSTTLFPASDLEDAPAFADPARSEPTAIPIEVAPTPAVALATSTGGVTIAPAPASST